LRHAIRFHDAMRFLLLLCALVYPLRAEVPRELAAALEHFRSEPPRGWSFTQTTVAEGRSTVERCDAARPEFARWSLVRKDDRAPTQAELQEYGEGRSRRSRTGTAPDLKDQFLLAAVELVSTTPDRLTYRCPLRQGESRDDTALHLRATIVVHRATGAVESIELANHDPFRPAFGVKIAELRTRMTYSLPQDGRPGLPQQVTTRVRGTAFWFKSLDGDLTVTFSDYVRVGKP
jgi:hypothetical protein